MNNHLVGKTDILEPRAKIGDVVIVEIRAANREVTITKHNQVLTLYEGVYDDDNYLFVDENILKNLTTNVSYEN